MKKLILMLILFCFLLTGMIAERFIFPIVQELNLSRLSIWRFPHFLKTNTMFVQMNSDDDIYFLHFNGTLENKNYGYSKTPYANFNGSNILLRDRDTNTHSLMNTLTKEITPLEKYCTISFSPAQYYQNGIVYGFWDDEQYEYYPTIGNINTGLVEPLPFYDKSKHGYVLIRDMSPDKMHLIWSGSETGTCLYDIQSENLSTQLFQGYLGDRFSSSMIFLTNSLAFGPVKGFSRGIQDMYGNSYIIEEINGIEGQSIIAISYDLTRCILESYNKKTNDTTFKLLDSTPLRDFLDKAGLLYKPTTATLNDDNVRVRENPNLEAKHMGFLKKGETISVLDRSGLKRTIEPWGEHYWYQIKRESDGLTGWAFGAFLDLKDEQGDIVINAEEIRKRVNQ